MSGNNLQEMRQFFNPSVEAQEQMRQNASLPGLLGGMKGLALEECTRRDPTQFHVLVVAYRNTTHYSIKAQQSRCPVRWASLAHFSLADCGRILRPAAILSAQYALNESS